MKHSRTKVLLWECLCNLIFRKKIEFSNLTINDICTEATVHRSTFYNHFADKYDLFSFGYHLSVEKKKKYSLEKQFRTPFKISEEIAPDLNSPLFFENLDDSLDEIIYDIQKQDTCDLFHTLANKGYFFELPDSFLIDFLLSTKKLILSHIMSGSISVDEADLILQKVIATPLFKTHENSPF